MTNKKYGDFDITDATVGSMDGTEVFLVKFANGTTNSLTMMEFLKYAMLYVQANLVWDKTSNASIGWASTIHTGTVYSEGASGTANSETGEGGVDTYRFGAVDDLTGSQVHPELTWEPVSPGSGIRPALTLESAGNWYVTTPFNTGTGFLFDAIPGTLTIRFRVDGALTRQKLILGVGNNGDGYAQFVWSHGSDD